MTRARPRSNDARPRRSDEIEPPVAVVTGGAIRVGRGIVEGLAHAGYRVWVHHYSSTERAAELANVLGSACLGLVAADLGTASGRAELVRVATAHDGPGGGRVDLLVNNAASFERGRFEERSDADLERVLALNLVAPLSLVRGLLPALRTAAGSVVNLLDLSADHPWIGQLDHAVAKAGLQTATRALAAELAPVRVNAVAPGTVIWPSDPAFDEGSAARAKMLEQIPAGAIGSPEDVAEAVLYLARARHVSGVTLHVDGGRRAALAGTYG